MGPTQESFGQLFRIENPFRFNQFSVTGSRICKHDHGKLTKWIFKEPFKLLQFWLCRDGKGLPVNRES